jgi:hypothetical protein
VLGGDSRVQGRWVEESPKGETDAEDLGGESEDSQGDNKNKAPSGDKEKKRKPR